MDLSIRGVTLVRCKMQLYSFMKHLWEAPPDRSLGWLTREESEVCLCVGPGFVERNDRVWKAEMNG